jgi:chromosome segregation ATPase
LDAWLLFFSSDKVEDIIVVIEQYPKFLPMYRKLYELCRNTEAVMGLFSEELQIMDDNTVRYMIDDMQEQIDRQGEALQQKDAEISRQGEALAQKDAEISRQEEALHQKDEEIRRLLQQVKNLQLQTK